jgi:outer membrane immunogenic protein
MLNLSRGVGAALVAGLLSAPAAFAADLPSMKSAPAAPVISSDWTGFYAGVETGASINTANWNTTALAVGAPVDVTSNLYRLNNSAFRLGALAGYNWQFNTWVLGVEGDFAGDMGARKTAVGLPGTIAYLAATPSSDSIGLQSTFDFALRGRLGYLVAPSTLVFATGGVAFINAKYSANCAGVNPNTSWCAAPDAGSSSGIRTGWTVGGGAEQRLNDRWSLRAEYRYTGYGAQSYTLLTGTDALTFKSNLSSQIATVALVYKFGVETTPAVVAKY